MKTLQQYLKEIRFLRIFIILIILVIVLSYSVYLFLSDKTIEKIGDEDKLFEWLTALCFLGVSLIFFVLYLKNRNLYFLLFTLIFFIGFGEEISWGQRIIGFDTPEKIRSLNVQSEFTIHNLEPLNTSNMSGVHKQGVARLLEINFLFKLFTLLFGIALPFFSFHMKEISKLTRILKLPVPPISIGIFFIVNWLVFRMVLTFIIRQKHNVQYYDTDTEIFEFVSSFILLVIGLFFYFMKTKAVPGTDIKRVI